MSMRLGSEYLLDALIGRGATGEVWRGSDSEGRELAFKLLRPELADDPDIVRRFLQERALFGVEHPNLVRVLDVVVESGRLAIVMDLVHGDNLRLELSRQGTLAPQAALAVLGDVLAGLAKLHALGIVHGDLKPENVLLAMEDGEIVCKVGDYGAATIVAEASVASSVPLLGTPLYMAPEVIQGQPKSPAMDVYSAGVMLYELLCGITPFAAPTMMGVLRGHLEHEPTRPVGVTDEVWSLIDRMLDKRPQRRPAAHSLVIHCQTLAEKLRGAPALPLLAVPPRDTTAAASTSVEPLFQLAPGAGTQTVLRVDRLTSNARVRRTSNLSALGLGTGVALATLLSSGAALGAARSFFGVRALPSVLVLALVSALSAAAILYGAIAASRFIARRRASSQSFLVGAVATRYAAAYLQALRRGPLRRGVSGSGDIAPFRLERR